MTYLLLRPDEYGREATELPVVLDVPVAAELLGISRSAAYALIKCGKWPTPVITLGRRVKIPTAPLLALLGRESGEPPISAGTICGSATPTGPSGTTSEGPA